MQYNVWQSAVCWGVQDLQHAIDLSPDIDAKAECHTERGMTYQKMHDFKRAVKDLKQVSFTTKFMIESLLLHIHHACKFQADASLCTELILASALSGHAV